MLFNSFQFLIFYVVVVTIFFALPQRRRWILLLAASYYFYMSWRPEYVVLIVATTVINYGAALGLERWARPAVRRLLLVVGVASSLSLLLTYKYLDFFGQSLRAGLAAVGMQVDIPLFDLILPLGISFYTFQSLGYTIDVYRGSIRAERHLGIFALYVSFFPQLVAGPIERSGNLIPQLRGRVEPNLTGITLGLRMMLWGLFKKVVIADHLATLVNRVYDTPEEFAGPILVLATFCFAIQIYCDFSGYSDIAIGAAKVMGYDLMRNFRQPYFATSMSDFWRRWHISLSTWFRDYVYVPLGGNRVGRWRWRLNIAVVFLLSGIWHGANWTFIAWGAIHATIMVVESLTDGLRVRLADALGLTRLPRLLHLLGMAVTFVLVLIAWTFFRAESIDDALRIIAGMSSVEGFQLATLWSLGLPRFELMVSFVAIGVLFAVDGIVEFSPRPILALWNRRPVRWLCLLAGIYAVVFFGVFGQVEFIYFQF